MQRGTDSSLAWHLCPLVEYDRPPFADQSRLSGKRSLEFCESLILLLLSIVLASQGLQTCMMKQGCGYTP